VFLLTRNMCNFCLAFVSKRRAGTMRQCAHFKANYLARWPVNNRIIISLRQATGCSDDLDQMAPKSSTICRKYFSQVLDDSSQATPARARRKKASSNRPARYKHEEKRHYIIILLTHISTLGHGRSKEFPQPELACTR